MIKHLIELLSIYYKILFYRKCAYVAKLCDYISNSNMCLHNATGNKLDS